MTEFNEERILRFPGEWEAEYKRTGFISQWRDELPELFHDYKGSTRIGTLDLFPQYALMYLLRKDDAIQSITWYKLASNPEASKNRERTLKYWAVMRQWMGKKRFSQLREALLKDGFSGFTGEPDLFCWEPKKGQWFFAEAKGGDELTETEKKWFELCQETLGDVAEIRVYRLRTEGL